MAGRFVSNNEYGAANLVALVLQYREKHGEIDDRLVELAGAIDDKIATLRNELLGGASSAYDTFKELQDLFLENKDLLEKLGDIAGKHVRFDVVQALTSAEKALARANIEAASLQAVNDAVANAMPSAPTATVSKVGGTATITLKDKDGTTSVEVHDGATGPVFQPHVDDEGVISWSNNGNLTNPAPTNIRGPQGPKGEGLMFDDLTPEQIAQIKGSQGDQGERGPQGFTFKPSVSASGVITWTNDGNLTNPPAVDIRGPKGDTGSKGDPFVFADFTQDQLDGLRGPQGVQGVDGERGATFTPSVSSSGVITWSNDKGLTNPPAANIRGPQGVQGVQGVDGEQGATFIPSVSSDGVISWSNNGNLTNPAPQNIRGPKGDTGVKGDPFVFADFTPEQLKALTGPQGERGFHFTPAVDGKGNLSWTNNGDLDNPATQNIRGYHFTPSVNDNGDLSWSNDGGLDNPASKNIRGPRGFTFTPNLTSAGILSFTNDGGLANPAAVDLTGPQGIQGERGYYFTPSVSNDGTLSWTNNGGLTNPSSKNIRGPQGFTFTPSLASDGTLSFTNNGGLSNPNPVNLTGPRGYHFTPAVDGKGNLSWTNTGDLDNPPAQNIRGYHFTPAVDGKGNLSWTNTGDLDNPPAQNIRGYHFTPSVDGKGNLSWTNNGEMENPATQNIRGYHYTPSVDGKGNLSWTNNGELDNPPTQNIRGYHYTPSVSNKGIISWTNNGGLTNPSPVDIKGPSIVKVAAGLANDVHTQAEWEDIIAAGEMSLLESDFYNLRVNDMMRWTGIWQVSEDYGDVEMGLMLFEGIATVKRLDQANHKVYFDDGVLLYGLPGARGPSGRHGTNVRRLVPMFETNQPWSYWEDSFPPGATTSFGVTNENFSEFLSGESVFDGIGDVAVISGTLTDRGYATISTFVQITSYNNKNSSEWYQVTGKVIATVYSGVEGDRGPKGEKGDPFVYDDFTAEQLEALRGPKGDKGDGLEYEDLTPEQIAEIKGPKGEDGKTPQVTFRLDDDGNLYYSVTY